MPTREQDRAKDELCLLPSYFLAPRMDDRDDSNSDHFPFAFLFGENASAVLADTLTGTLDFDTKVKPDPDAEQRQQHAGPLATDDDDGGSVSDDDDDDDEDNKLVVTRTAAVSKPSPAPQGGRIVVPLAKPSSSGWALPPPLPHYPTQHLLRGTLPVLLPPISQLGS